MLRGVFQHRFIQCFYWESVFFADNQYDEDDDEITPDLWQEACWIVIR